MANRIKRVYLYHHTHTDIGYTHPQEEVVEQQAANIARALDFCDQTGDRSAESRFAWTVETGWTLARFWERASEDDRARFARYAREGRVQITASYFHLTQLATPELLARSLTSTFDIAKACGVTVDTAMSSDINGVNWFYVHLLAQSGVRYLNTAVNPTRGGSPLPDERPGGFWWVGPTGERLLVWNNDVYMTGNEVLSFPTDPSYEGLQHYCARLEERGYPYDTVVLPLQGFHIDNAMPNIELCDMVEAFNREAGYALCHFVTLGEALRDVEARYGDSLPVYRGAWPDWWDDGIASSAFETGLVRFSQGDLLAAEKAAALATALGAPEPFPRGELHLLAENLLHYDEHTWGWWRSIEDPHSLESRALGHRKILYAEDAAMEGRRYRERALRALAAHVAPVAPGADRVIVFNPLAERRREIVRHWAVWRHADLTGTAAPAGTQPTGTPLPVHAPMSIRVLDASGAEVASQCEVVRYTGHLIPHVDLWVEFEADIPALGYQIYTLERTDQPVALPIDEVGHSIENDFYRATMDSRGVVTSLFDKELGRELAAGGPWGLNQVIYEQITSPGGRADTLAAIYPPFNWGAGRAELALSSPETAEVHIRRDRFGVSLISHSALPQLPSIVQEIRLPFGHKQVDFSTRMVKDEVDGAEAGYIAFPFALKPNRVSCDISGGVFTPGAEQIRGTATDWYNVQHGVQLADDEVTLTWLCAEAPLVEFGEMKTGKTPSPPILDNGLLFSYVFNNHWMTNFFARQSGEIVARYRLHSEQTSSPARLAQAGRLFLSPLVAAHLGARSARDAGLEIASDSTNEAAQGYVLSLEGDAALDGLKTAHDGEGWIVRLHETTGNSTSAAVRLRWPVAVRAEPCDLLERSLGGETTASVDGTISVKADLAPFGTASWRLRPAP